MREITDYELEKHSMKKNILPYKIIFTYHVTNFYDKHCCR